MQRRNEEHRKWYCPPQRKIWRVESTWPTRSVISEVKATLVRNVRLRDFGEPRRLIEVTERSFREAEMSMMVNK